MTTSDSKDVGMTALTRREPRVDHENPWSDDQLERRNVADSLTNLVKAQKGPFVVALNGDWGTGKTFFLERWHKHIEKATDGCDVIYYNAWKDDFFEDPLVPLLASIMRTTEDPGLRSRITKIATKDLVWRNAQSLAMKFAGVALPDLGDDVMKAYEDQAKTRDKLRKALIEVLQNSQPEPSLIVIVDELDRCRPDFAVATLERTKHIFDIPGLVFVYGINRRELCKSVASLYGNIDADVYVRRFFDMEFTLPSVNPSNYCSYLARRYAIPTNIEAARLLDGRAFVHAIPSVLRTFANLSLRDIEQCVRIAAVASLNMAQGKIGFHYETIVAVIVIRLINNDLYQQFARGEHVAGKMIDFLFKNAVVGDNSWLNRIQGRLYAVCDEPLGTGEATAYAELQRFRQEASDGSVPETELLADVTRNLDEDSYSCVVRDVERVRADERWQTRGGEYPVLRWHPALVSLIELAAGT